MSLDKYETASVKFPFNWGSLPIELRRHVAEVPGQQRALSHDGHLLLLLHRAPSEESWEREVLLYWRDPEGEWKSSENGKGLASLKSHLEQYAAVVQELEDAAEQIETAEQCYRARRRLAPIHRAAHNQMAAMVEAQELCPEDQGLSLCRNIAGNICRATDLLTEEIRSTFDYAMARAAERQSRSAYRFSLLTATFFPIMTFATIFGMNVTSGLESRTPILFWLLFAAGAAMGLSVRSFVTDESD
ncbi:MAG: hypothetical protein KDB14_21860 [Planctomycetales bacterium]|nr:hypothetical protein [Planctomycetales bacterium]